MIMKTALYDCHVAAGGNPVEFAGYYLPIQYPTGLMKEHEAVRNRCGLFDVSHMGEITFKGPGALEALNHLLTNNYSDQKAGSCRYSVMCYPDGGCVDDLIVYKYADDDYLVIVNASNKDKDFAWMTENQVGDVEIKDVSAEYTQLALQGPLAKQILSKLTDPAGLPEGYYTFEPSVIVDGIDCIVSRTGYTGEDGYELYCAWDKGPELWDALLAAGQPEGLIPCGLGARDVLRLEASMPLYGHEMDAEIDPREAGLGIGIKMDKPDFIGKDALVAKGDPKRKRVGIEVTGRGIVREHCPIFFEGKEIGFSTSGTYLPILGKACAMALVETDSVDIDDVVEAEVRGKRIECKVVKMPFYKIDRSKL